MIRVTRGGLLTTVQDLGRAGMQQHGVAVGGAMDTNAHRITNLLVGNPDSAAALECTMLGPELELADDALLAIGGGDLGATLNGDPVPLWCPFIAPAGSTLSFTAPRAGCRAYVAFGGGIDVPLVLGSRGTDLIAGIGGLDGRALQRGDEVATAVAGDLSRRIRDRLHADPRHARSAGRSLLPRHASEPVVRIMPGPEHERFSSASRELLTAGAFAVSPQSNRMGIRLAGPALALEGLYDLHSSPVATGTIQVPPSGDPIVLMADHQTIGGYPRIAAVITVDLPLLAQAPPGMHVRFRSVDVVEAQSVYLRREHDLRVFAESLRLHYRT